MIPNWLVIFYTFLALAGVVLSLVTLWLKAGDKTKLKAAGVNGLGKLFANKEVWEERGRVVKLLSFVVVGGLSGYRRIDPAATWTGMAIGGLFMLIITVMVGGSILSLFYRVAIRRYERTAGTKTRAGDGDV